MFKARRNLILIFVLSVFLINIFSIPILGAGEKVEPESTLAGNVAPWISTTPEPSETPTVESTTSPTQDPSATPTVETSASPTEEPKPSIPVAPWISTTPTPRPTSTPKPSPTPRPTNTPTPEITPYVKKDLEPIAEFTDEMYDLKIEVEDFEIFNGSIVDDANASGGEAVFVDWTQFIAEGFVYLYPGTYLAWLYENAPSGLNDGLHFQFNDADSVRTYFNAGPGTYGRCSTPLELKVTEEGKYSLKLYTTDEALMLLDYIMVERYSIYKSSKEAQKLRDLGLFYGVSTTEWDPALGEKLDRQQGMTMLVRLLGFEDEATALTDAEADSILAKFEDKAEISDWAKKNVAYCVQNNLVFGMSNTIMGPKIQLTGKMFATIILRNLGMIINPPEYERACFILEEKGGIPQGYAGGLNNKRLLRDDFVYMSYNALNAVYQKGEYKDKTIAHVLVKKNVISMETLEKTSPDIFASILTAEPTLYKIELDGLSVSGAKELTLEFNKNLAPEEIETLDISVAKSSLDMTSQFTVSWTNENKTAILNKSTNMAVGNYTVSIKSGDKDIGSKSASVAKEEVTKIIVPQDTFLRYNNRDGEVRYKVFNQYDEDITNKLLSTLSFYCSNGTVTKLTNGIVKISTTDNIYQNGSNNGTLPLIPNITLTVMDSTSGVSIKKSMEMAPQIGGIDAFEITGITTSTGSGNVQVGRNEEYFIEYEAIDIDGNPVYSYNLFNNSDVFTITVSDSALAEVIIETDPEDSYKARFRLNLLKQTLDYDQPITIHALFKNIGISSTTSLTVKRNASVASINILAPDVDLVAGEKTEIEFEAFDQQGEPLTKWADIVGSTGSDAYITFTNIEQENHNGELKLYIDTSNNSSGEVLNVTALVKKTGNLSQFTATLQPKAYPYKIASLDYVKFISVSPGSSCLVDVSNFNVYDQYDRPYDMMYKTNEINGLDTDGDGDVDGNDQKAYFYIEASILNGSTKITLNSDKAYGENNKIKYTGKPAATSAYGNATLKFQLKATTGSVGGTAITNLLPTDQKNVTVTNYDTDDISAIMMEKVPALFANYAPASDAKFNVIGTDLNSTTISAVTDVYGKQWEAWANDVKVYGVVNGVKVEIDQNIVTYSYDTSKYKVISNLTSSPEFIRIIAYSFPTHEFITYSKLTATAVIGTNTFSTFSYLASQKQAPKAKSIDVVAKSTFTPLGTIYEISATDVASNVIGKCLSYYNPSTGDGGYYDQSGISDIYFKITDQYNSTGLVPDNIIVKNTTGNTGTVEISTATNIISLETGSPALVAGDSFDIIVSSGGITKTITIRIT